LTNRDRAECKADRAIAAARIQLAAATHRHLNPAAVTRIDALPCLPASDPTLGME
jgi:hypothetical protein